MSRARTTRVWSCTYPLEQRRRYGEGWYRAWTEWVRERAPGVSSDALFFTRLTLTETMYRAECIADGVEPLGPEALRARMAAITAADAAAPEPAA